MSPIRPTVVAMAVLTAAGRLAAEPPTEVVDLRGIILMGGKIDAEKAALRGLDAETIELPRPTLRYAPARRYAELTKLLRAYGRVVLECRVETTGRLEDCKVARPLSPPLDAAALETVITWRYSPLKLRGEVRAALMHVGVPFLRGSTDGLEPPPEPTPEDPPRSDGRQP